VRRRHHTGRAVHAGRHAIGVEYERRWADLILASPPYGRTLHGRVEHRHGPLTRFADTYGHPDPAHLAHRGRLRLLDGITAILRGCAPPLRPGGTIVVTARPWRRRGLLVDLPGAVITAGIAAGLQPVERCVALLAAVRDGRLVPRHSFYQLSLARDARRRGVPLHLISHEDLVVFRGPEKSPSSKELKDPQRELQGPRGSVPVSDPRVRGEDTGRVW